MSPEEIAQMERRARAGLVLGWLVSSGLPALYALAWLYMAWTIGLNWWLERPPSFFTMAALAFLAFAQACRHLDISLTRWGRRPRNRDR